MRFLIAALALLLVAADASARHRQGRRNIRPNYASSCGAYQVQTGAPVSSCYGGRCR